MNLTADDPTQAMLSTLPLLTLCTTYILIMLLHHCSSKQAFVNSTSLDSTLTVHMSMIPQDDVGTKPLENNLSPTMSSYLICLQIGPFSLSLSSQTQPRFKILVFLDTIPRLRTGCSSSGLSAQLLLSSRMFSSSYFHPAPNPQHRGVAKHNMTFLVSTLFAIAGSLLLLIGASIWTVIVQRSAAINDLVVESVNGSRTMPLGINVSVGPGLFLTWAAFACLVVSVIPYMIRFVIFSITGHGNLMPSHSCCTYR